MVMVNLLKYTHEIPVPIPAIPVLETLRVYPYPCRTLKPTDGTIHILRFDPALSPFLQRNCWHVTEKPPFMLQHDQIVEMERYGTVKLEILEEQPDWVVFCCMGLDGQIATDIVISKEWLEAVAKEEIAKRVCYWIPKLFTTCFC
jgi:hypothetical protein